jgi:hypothetical protein
MHYWEPEKVGNKLARQRWNTRSVPYALDSVLFSVGVNVGYLTRKSRRQ